jgi:hypothetical protein
MSRAADYLWIPQGYTRSLRGLRWSPVGDAIEDDEGTTFALNQEIALFLEGFGSQRPLVHFAFILHLLWLLKRGSRDLRTLPQAFDEARKPLRTAGAFCAVLCAQVPSTADPPEVLEVWHALMSSSYVAGMGGALPTAAPPGLAEVAPWPPAAFEAHVVRALSRYRYEEMLDWLRHGRGPVRAAGEEVARAVTALKPRSLGGVLAALAQRERLAGAVPLVRQLVSALTLPPRRLAHHELPVGGYSDVATRGHPEQVLPSQFAVDDLEFVRRFAENELLYFRREEPHARVREELVVLLDQGVRTWGNVRLLLSATLFAFGKLAARRKLPLQVAATSTGGELHDPLGLEDATLGELLEASDLTPHPGRALERVLEDRPAAARDVVLLTHPRSLDEADVGAAARRVLPGTRLFAVAADEQGHLSLDEVRHGTAVPLSRFRVDLSAGMNAPATAKPVRPAPPADPAAPWSGDVEPIGFPFRFGITGKIPDGLYDFDGSGEWLLVASLPGMLHAVRTDGSGTEVLPRPLLGRALLTKPQAVVGVAGGFVVLGPTGSDLAAAHYDFRSRTCQVYRLGGAAVLSRNRVHYVPAAHSIVVRDGDHVRGLDLGTGECFVPKGEEFAPASRVQAACRSVLGTEVPAPGLWTLNLTTPPPERLVEPALYLNAATGTLTPRGLESEWKPFTPLAEGQPLLRGCKLMKARWQRDILGIVSADPVRRSYTLYLYRAPEGTPLSEFRQTQGSLDFVLSADSRLLARKVDALRLEVRELHGGSGVVFTPKGGSHSGFLLELGERWLTVKVGRFVHLVRWDSGRLEVCHVRSGDTEDWLRRELSPKRAGAMASARIPRDYSLTGTIGRICADPDRFLTAAFGVLTAVTDRFGQIALLDYAERLVCMLFVFRSRVAAWLPDGTRFGPPGLTGRPETAGAAEKIGRALSEAWEQGDLVRT